MTVVGAVGLFAKLKYRYDDRMDELEAERRGAPAGRGIDGKRSDGKRPDGKRPDGKRRVA